jgi:hypothetical protein
MITLVKLVDAKNWLKRKLQDERFFFGYNLFILVMALSSIVTSLVWIGIFLAGVVLELNFLMLVIMVLQDYARARMRQ